jgi:hypothetical protein
MCAQLVFELLCPRRRLKPDAPSPLLALIGALPLGRWSRYFFQSEKLPSRTERVVSKSLNKPARPWRVVADEMSHANRGDRVLELAEELERAFHEQTPAPRKSIQAAPPHAADTGGDQQNKLQQRKQS